MDRQRSKHLGILVFGLILSLIIGVNANKRPRCTETFYTTEFDEGLGDSAEVFALDCSDQDSGLDGELTYSLSEGGKGQFRVDSETGSVKVIGTSDAERLFESTGQLANPYTLSIIVADKGTPPFSKPATVFINMKSVNDNTPRLESLPSSILVSETEPVGSLLANCTLIDDDVDDSNHGTAYVRIKSGNEDGKFVINQINCDLRLISPLDFETKPKHTLVLEAYDLDPVNPLTSTKELVIDVGDVNDFRPACVGYNILREVSEESPVATTLTTVECFDKDDGVNGQLEYKVSKGDPRLTIDKISGNVSLIKPLDFEKGDLALEVVIIVCDLGSPSLSSTVTVVFKVRDADDNPPQFTETSYNRTVSENTMIGSIILTITAKDFDSPNTDLSRITYGLEEPCDSDWFLVDAHIGSIVVKNALDWETSSHVICKVHAYSSDRFEDRSLTNVSIYLTDVNDREPIFSKFLFSGSISEDASLGTLVIKVEADDPDDGINGDFNFSMPGVSPFTIDPNTGDITLNGSIDYEVKSHYLLTVMAKDKGVPTQSSLTYINIQIDPVNEYGPVISSGLSLSVSEDAEPGTALTAMTADDKDAGQDGEVEFFLLDSNVPFLLESTTGLLRIGIGLDRETTTLYELTVMVKDKSNTTIRSSSSTILVTVLDVNDNAPNCSLVPKIHVSPPTTTGALLTQLTCTDPDENNKITYRLVGGDDDGIFNVNSVNGKVTLASSPITGSYVLLVDVEDDGAPKLKVTLPVQVIIEGQLIFDNLPKSLQLYENVTDLSSIFTVNTSGVWDFVSTEILSGNDDNTFNLNPVSGDIRLIRLLDRETRSSYTLRVRAVSSNGQLIEGDLNIDVLDLNDATPVFDNTFYHFKVVETLPAPAIIKTVIATDGDEGSNSDIEYSILSGNDGGNFDYAANGDFKIVKELNYEKSESYTVVIQATDKGDDPLSSTAVVFIEVINQDDNPLVIASSNTNMSLDLKEDVAVGKQILRINASDLDIGEEIRFSIESGNELRYFVISEENGTLFTATSPDHETTQNVSLVVKVENSAGVSKTLSVDVDILDVNDNTPVFSKQFYSASVPHALPADTYVGEVKVTDKDSESNGLVILTILSGNDKNHFRLIGSKLETVVVLDSGIQDFYSIVIQARDSGFPSRSSTAIFQIKVDEKLEKPQFALVSASFNFEETKSPEMVYDCDATTAGATEGKDGNLRYSIVDGNTDDTFFIDSYTGKVDLIKPLDYNSVSSFSLEILASNIKNYLLNDSFTLTITVMQVNRRTPEFTKQIYAWSIPENIKSGTELGFVRAIDSDVGDFGEVVYTLESNIKFDLNSSTGVIKTVAVFDYQVSQSYHLFVVARDKGTPVSRSSSAIVIVTIEDINDHTPTFDHSNYEVSLPETATPPLDFYVVVAKDGDTGSFGEISYSIISGDKSVFGVEASTGVLKLLSPVDYEVKTEFILEITGQDKGTPPLTGTTTLTVSIIDTNDHVPTFRIKRVDVSVPSHAPPFMSVYNASATDKDQRTSDSTINYLITAGNDLALFSIDSDTGEIKTGREIVPDDSTFELIVIAVDQGSPPLTGTTTVGVQITPAVPSGPSNFDFSVEENKSTGTFVGQIPKDPALSVTGYEIISGNYNKDLSIVKTSQGDGVIRTSRPLDRESYALYQLTVLVQHSAGEKTIKVKVTVTDVNDNDPMIKPSSLSIRMVENTPSGKSLEKITATDADAGTNGDVDFTISASTPLGKKYFSIDNSGLLSVAAEIDHEIFQTLDFDVIVKDRGATPRSVTVPVSVTIENVIETLIDDPSLEDISSAFMSVVISGSMKDGDLVFVATPGDFDINFDPSDTVRYTSVGTNVFSIDSRSGQVKIGIENLLYPSSSYLQWMVCSVSNGNSSTTKLAMIRIDTFDVNTNLVAVVISLSVEDLEAQRTNLQARLQSFFSSPNVVHIWAIQSTSSSNKRRRLLVAESVALVVVATDNTTGNVGNVDQSNSFLTQSQVLGTLQTDSSGNPVTGLSDGVIPVTHVVPYKDNSSDETDANSAEIGFFLIAAIAAVVALLLIAGLTAYCILRYRKSKKLKMEEKNSDKEHLCEESSRNVYNDEVEELQNRALELMRSSLHKQLPPLETEIGNHPFQSYRPPSRALRTPMGLKRPIQLPPLATEKFAAKKEASKWKRLIKHNSKNSKSKSSSSKSVLTLINDPDQVVDNKKDVSTQRKRMVQSLEEEQIEQGKLFLLKLEREKRIRVENMRRKRRVSEIVDQKYKNALLKIHNVKNAWRSPKSSSTENPFKDQFEPENDQKSSPYKANLPRPYRTQLLNTFHSYLKTQEENEDANRRKSLSGFENPPAEDL